MRNQFIGFSILCALSLGACSAPQTETAVESEDAPVWATRSGDAPLVIAHRGASGERPEHSALAYKLALEQGADIIEPDLQMSSDGQLIVRHDPYLSTSTDIADRPEFADRRVERFGQNDWWVADFTAAELQSLNTRQVFEDRSDAFDDQSPVMTFDDFLDFVEAEQALCDCVIPIEPEVKQPAAYEALGLDPLPALLEALEARNLNVEGAPVIIQSFDFRFLQRLRPETPLRLAMLNAGDDEEGYNAGALAVEEIAVFADAVGPHKAMLMHQDGVSKGYLEAVHASGMDVHVWTVRDDRAPWGGETVEDELRALYALGVDGVFTDHPETALRVRAEMAAELGLPL